MTYRQIKRWHADKFQTKEHIQVKYDKFNYSGYMLMHVKNMKIYPIICNVPHTIDTVQVTRLISVQVAQ